MIDRFIPPRFRRFISVGAVGFLIEAIVLQALVSLLSMHAFSAVLIAFAVAVTVTWLLNRSYTFKVEQPHNFVEWFKYTGVNSAGGVIHLAVYGALVIYFPLLQQYPLVPLVISSAVAAGFNYSMSSSLVFDTKRSAETGGNHHDG
jgi:putative flippase GtrA